MPASTDLVTDLPADFALFGDAVDLDISSRGGYTTTATAAGTTTLTILSNRNQRFTGVTTQTVVMPVASTLAVGAKWKIQNKSTGIVTVQSSGANTIIAIAAGASYEITCILASGTTAASWDYDWAGATSPPSAAAVTLISQQTVTGSSVANIEFAAIPGTYKNLRIVYNALITSGSWDHMHMRFNNDTAGNYISQTLSAIQTTLTGAELVAGTYMRMSRVAQTGASTGFIAIANYSGAILKKSAISQGVSLPAYTTGGVQLFTSGNGWDNTAAITEIDLFSGTGNWEVGSSFTLYGES